ncbi:MAG TPA: DUF2617 family protein [Phycisphaerales bacterium]|nr:DUF2617 family protein [Phycisphaerales bacterium]
MSTPTRTSVQSYQLVLYKRALHPELFDLKARKTVRHGAYELEAWLMPGAHLLRFSHGGVCACELVTPQDDGLPTEGALTNFPTAGERDFEHEFPGGLCKYIASVQTETLSENLFRSTLAEMVQFAEETDSMLHRWDDPELGRCLSVLDIQRYSKEIHAQSYHLVGGAGFVLRTQTIFEHR